MSSRSQTARRPSPEGAFGPLRVVYATAILAAPAAIALHVSALCQIVQGSTALPVLAGLACGALLADFVSGVVHWTCDTWGSERTPLVGPLLIRAFREHHVDPCAMGEHDWIEVNGEVAAGAVAALLLLLAPPLHTHLLLHPAFYACLTTSIVLAGWTNQIHQWTHSERIPRVVGQLQRAGLVLAPARHREHHRPPHLGGYCITTGWLNPLLDRTGFWRGLESAITRATGIRPRDGAGGLGQSARS